MSSASSRFSLGLWLAAGALIALALLFNFYHLGITEFFQNAPAQMAADVRQMNQRGEWLAPVTAQGGPSLESAPLYVWAAKLTSRLSAEVKPFAARLPASACSVLLILFTAFWFFQHLKRSSREDEREPPPEGFALIAGLIIASSPTLYSVGREGTPASMFALLYLIAAWCWAESLEARRSFYAGFSPRFWLLWGYAAAGVAMLVQGPLPLVLLWIPYFCVSRSYHLRRPDFVGHLIGLALAFALGAWWPLSVGLNYPAAAGKVWNEWLRLRAFNSTFSEETLINFLAAPDSSPLAFIWKLLLSSFPWCLVALVMLGRVWRREDRSPTLVYWTWTLLANTLLLAFVDQHASGRLLLIPFIALMTADALYRWDFENAWAAVWRAVLRVSIITAIATGLFMAILLSEPVWIVIFALAPVVWLIWVWRMRRADVTYSRWAMTVRLSGMMLVLVSASLAMLLGEWEPRLNFNREAVSYFARVREQLKEHEGPVYYLGERLPGLYAYYGAREQTEDAAGGTNTARPPVLVRDVGEARPVQGKPAVIFASHNLSTLMEDRSLEPLAVIYGDHANFKEAMLRVKGTDPSPPFTLALLGNTGTRSRRVSEVARLLDRAARRLRLQDVVLLGNNVYGPNLFDHLDFFDSFEVPFHRLLRRGMVFHALIGHEDEDYAWFQTHYNPFNMNGRRAYSRLLGGGLVEIFMLDAAALKQNPEAGLNEIEGLLAKSKAPWKLAALHPALLSGAEEARTEHELQKLLLPEFDKHHVQLIAWGGGFYYERLKDPAHKPLMLNCGWSGGESKVRFGSGDAAQRDRQRAQQNARQDAHQAGMAGTHGMVLLEFTTQTLTWRAVTRKGMSTDEGELSLAGDLLSSGSMTLANIESRGTLIDAVETTESQTLAKSDAEKTTGARLRTMNLQSEAPFTTQTRRIIVNVPAR